MPLIIYSEDYVVSNKVHYWRASEVSETLLCVTNGNRRYMLKSAVAISI